MAKKRMAGGKGKGKKLSKNQNLLVVGAGLAALIFFLKKKAPQGAQVTLGLTPAKVGAGETVSAESYRVIKSRRAGMQYAPVSEGAIGSMVTFTSPVAGMFTRNLVQEGEKIVAEIKG